MAEVTFFGDTFS